MTTLIDVCLLILASLFCVTGKSCDIVENMSCQCHSSFNGESQQLICNNYNNQIDSKIKLTNAVLKMAPTFDTFHLTFNDQEVNISAMFLNDLSYLFPRYLPSTPIKGKSKIDIKLSFPNFSQLRFEDYAFYQLFGERSDVLTRLTLELTSNGQVTFSSMALNQLKVDQMIIHSSSLEPYSFEEIFNNTNIADLMLEGFAPRCNETLKATFNGKIQSAKFTKMVEVVSNEEFPSYPVRSMTIEAHEARRMNASTFMNYRNLNGLHLIRPMFFFDNRSFNGLQYLANLETIELDAESIKDHTFKHVARIRNLILGPSVRYLSANALDHVNYLKNFDASKITLDQLYPSARCVLARYIDKQKETNPQLNIVPPQAEYCDCIYDFISSRLNRKPDNFYLSLCENNQQERCQLSECDIVKHFRLPLPIDENSRIVPSIVETIPDPPINFYPIEDQQTTHRAPLYVHRYPFNVKNENQSVPSSHSDVQIIQTSALKVDESVDSNSIPIAEYDEPPELETNLDEDRYRLAMEAEKFKWISLSLVWITILCLLLVGTLIWFFSCYRKKRQEKSGFQPVLDPNSTV